MIFLFSAHNCGIREQGWSLVRHVNDDSGIWHVASDHLAGTQIYGNHLRSTFSQSGHWTLNFEEVVPDYDEFLLATGDCSNWLMMKKDELIAHYDNSGMKITFITIRN